MSEGRAPAPPVLAIALPPLLVSACLLFAVAATPFGFRPFWPVVEMTLPEAAALNDAGAVVRLIEQGRNPNERGAVRAGIVAIGEVHLTPLEATLASRAGSARVHMFQVLLRYGAKVDGKEREDLTCVALNEAREVVPLLDETDEETLWRRCKGFPKPW